MPRKRRKFIVTVEPPEPPIDPKAATLEELVGAILKDFDELSVLPTSTKELLIRDLVESVRRARAGLRFRRRGVGDGFQTVSVFLADLATALTAAGIKPARWRKNYDGRTDECDDAESLFFKLARALAGDAGLKLPADLKLVAQASTQWVKAGGSGRRGGVAEPE